MDTRGRLVALYDDLGNMDARSNVGWQVGLVFNAILEQAKQDHADDPVVGAVEPVKQSASANVVASMDAGTLRAIVGQLRDSYPTPPPFA